MNKRLIATLSILSTLGGAALVALILHLQRGPSRFSLEAAAPLAVVEARAAATPLAPVQAESTASMDAATVIELQPIYVTPQTPRGAPLSIEPKALEPCSPWRELGPNYVEDGSGIGTRRVRELC